MKVYRKESKFKDSEGKVQYWYSGTNNKGESCVVNFKCDIPDKYKEEKAFQITNIVGNKKTETVNVNGQDYMNAKYYVTSCEFSDMPVEALDD